MPDEIIDKWIIGLPTASVLHIVSLLGRKTDGFSEFEYYPFRSVEESGAKPSFQEWLNEKNPDQRYTVHEIPTVDHGLPPDTVERVAKQVNGLLATNLTVIIIDSAGDTRTGQIAKRLGYK